MPHLPLQPNLQRNNPQTATAFFSNQASVMARGQKRTRSSLKKAAKESMKVMKEVC